jgi:CBS domain-containing protein
MLARSRLPAITIAPTEMILTALALMEARNISALLVTEGERLVGILAERDCVRKLDLKGRRASETAVGDIMTKDVLTVTSDRAVPECRKIMSERKVRHLPVVDEGRIIGVLSIRDVLEEVIAEDERQVQNLATELGAYKGLY